MFEGQARVDEVLADLCGVEPEFAVGAAGEFPGVASTRVEEVIYFDVIGVVVEEAGEDSVGFAADGDKTLRAFQLVGCEIAETKDQASV